MIWFALASLSPLALLTACCLWAVDFPWLVWAALSYQTIAVFMFDQSERRLPAKDSPLLADALSVVLGLGHLAILLPVLVTARALDGIQGLVLLIVLGLFMGQVSHPNAHELIHQPGRSLRRLGVWVYGSMLLGHHVSAHLKVHHSHVATAQDPNTARRGEGFYRFFWRAWIGSFRAGLAAENIARARKSHRPAPLSHPYLGYALIAGLTLLAAALAAGIFGLIACVCVAIYAQAQVFLADYVQHYGLHRALGENGKPEPVGPRHSWNAPHWYSSAMMLNAPRHSDHHVNPKRRFPGLQLTSEMPLLPHSLPVMAVIALIPPLWHRVMERELRHLQKGPHAQQTANPM
ncbi:alkane 1-monooxygenase [Pseudophaeobacter sp.]|uniref:alkane 1-monooxygenase n=1 Tax=Pseudophaeobacter sp. TaxID=1971739 RepID=UPI0032999281